MNLRSKRSPLEIYSRFVSANVTRSIRIADSDAATRNHRVEREKRIAAARGSRNVEIDLAARRAAILRGSGTRYLSAIFVGNMGTYGPSNGHYATWRRRVTQPRGGRLIKSS